MNGRVILPIVKNHVLPLVFVEEAAEPIAGLPAADAERAERVWAESGPFAQSRD